MIVKIFKRNLFQVAGSVEGGRWQVRRPDGRLCAGTWASLEDAERMCEEKNKIDQLCQLCRVHIGRSDTRFILKRARTNTQKGTPGRWLALGDVCQRCNDKHGNDETTINEEDTINAV